MYEKKIYIYYLIYIFDCVVMNSENVYQIIGFLKKNVAENNNNNNKYF